MEKRIYMKPLLKSFLIEPMDFSLQVLILSQANLQIALSASAMT